VSVGSPVGGTADMKLLSGSQCISVTKALD